MRFDLDEEQDLLARSTREMLEKEASLDRSRDVMETREEGYAKPFYIRLGALGYPGLLLPKDEGGLGAIAFAAVLAEMGRVALPGPFLDLAVAVRTLSSSGAEASAELLQRAVAGRALVVWARCESRASADPGTPEARCADGRVSGTKTFVPFGAYADALLVETREGIALVERPASGWNAVAQETIDHAQRFAEITLDDPATLLASGDEARTLLAEAERLGALGAAAQMFGLMESSLEKTVAYVGEREAFGAPIGSFQVLQHRCADMLLQAESTRSAVFRAAWAEEHAPETATDLVAVAKAWAGPAGRFVCGQTIQLHGGVGFTWEYAPHIYLKRLKTLETFYGSTSAQLDRVLEASGWLEP